MGNPTQTPAAVTDPTSGMALNPSTGQPVGAQDPAMMQQMQQAQSGQMQAEQAQVQAEQQNQIQQEKEKAERETSEARHKLELQSMQEQMKLKDMEMNMQKKLEGVGRTGGEGEASKPALSPALTSRIAGLKSRISKTTRPNAATQAKMVMAHIKVAGLSPAKGLSSAAGPSLQMRAPQQAQARTQQHQGAQVQQMRQRGAQAVAQKQQQQVADQQYAQQQVRGTGQQQMGNGTTHYYADRTGAANATTGGQQPQADMATMPIQDAPRNGGPTASPPVPPATPQEYLYGLNPEDLYGRAPIHGADDQFYSPIAGELEGETGPEMMKRYLTGEGIEQGDRNWAEQAAAQRFLDRRGVGSHNEAADYFTQLYGPEVGQTLAKRVFGMGNDRIRDEFVAGKNEDYRNAWWNPFGSNAMFDETTGADDYELMDSLMKPQQYYGTVENGTVTPEQRLSNIHGTIDRMNWENDSQKAFQHRWMMDQDDGGALGRNYTNAIMEQNPSMLRDVPVLGRMDDATRAGLTWMTGGMGDMADATAARERGDWGTYGREMGNSLFGLGIGGTEMTPLGNLIGAGFGDRADMSRAMAQGTGQYAGVADGPGATDTGLLGGSEGLFMDPEDPEQRQLLGQFENVVPMSLEEQAEMAQTGTPSQEWMSRVAEALPFLLQLIGNPGQGGGGYGYGGTDPYAGMPSTSNEYYSGMYPNYANN